VSWNDVVWGQFGAAIDMLENAIRACPERVWTQPGAGSAPFWYTALHALYFLDVYLDTSEEACVPPAPFARADDAPQGATGAACDDGLAAWARLDGLRLPAHPYTRDEVLGYLPHGRTKCVRALASMTLDDAAAAADGFPWLGLTRGELMLYNMRHVQHHAAQLNLLLRQGGGPVPAWVRHAAGDARVAGEGEGDGHNARSLPG